MTWFCEGCSASIEPKDIYARGEHLVHEVITKDKVIRCGPIKRKD